jgi:hypothetical protein
VCVCVCVCVWVCARARARARAHSPWPYGLLHSEHFAYPSVRLSVDSSVRALIFIAAIEVPPLSRLPRPGSSCEVQQIILRYVRQGLDRETMYKSESLSSSTLLWGPPDV